jgi:hypothetical protein
MSPAFLRYQGKLTLPRSGVNRGGIGSTGFAAQFNKLSNTLAQTGDLNDKHFPQPMSHLAGGRHAGDFSRRGAGIRSGSTR